MPGRHLGIPSGPCGRPRSQPRARPGGSAAPPESPPAQGSPIPPRAGFASLASPEAWISICSCSATHTRPARNQAALFLQVPGSGAASASVTPGQRGGRLRAHVEGWGARPRLRLCLKELGWGRTGLGGPRGGVWRAGSGGSSRKTRAVGGRSAQAGGDKPTHGRFLSSDFCVWTR